MEKILLLMPFLVLYLDVKSLLRRIDYLPLAETVNAADYGMAVLIFVFGAAALFAFLRKKQPGLITVISFYGFSLGVLYAMSIITVGNVKTSVIIVRIICTVAAILTGSYYIQKEIMRLKK